jgi:hypothetical protein
MKPRGCPGRRVWLAGCPKEFRSSRAKHAAIRLARHLGQPPDGFGALTADPDDLLGMDMVHVRPWAATLGRFAGAARLLGEGGPL